MRKGRFANLGDDAGGDAVPPATAPLLSALAFPAVAASAAIAAVTITSTFSAPVATLAAALLGGASVLVSLTLTRARFLQVMSANAESTSARARGFVGLAEEGGQYWFWETNADGHLTYLSPGIGESLGREHRELIGRPFEELLLIEEKGADNAEEPGIHFHMSSRFPFVDVIVRPNGNHELGWLLSGTPRFDEVGRFMGFQGYGAKLTAEKKEQAKATRLARFDSLTGLPNRARIEALLDEALANAESRKQSCALFLIDLDRFKQVNDTLGHPVGDVLLQQVAERLTTALGEDGQAGRLGGDEFEAVFPGIGEEGRLASMAESLIRSLSEPYRIHGHKVTIGASVGVAISRPGKTYRQSLVKEADLALYAAKRAGRGTFRFFEPEMHAEETDRKLLENDLKSAVAKGQLKLLYQPIVSVATENLVGFEALVRWWHPTRGPLSPSDFLPIAASAGQMPALGEWILRTACAEAAKWPSHVRLAVNIAPEQLAGPGIAAVAAGALGSSGLEPERLEVEVQEEALLGDPAALEALVALHGLGIQLVLDDFGKGAASLSSLKTAPLGRIKLHPSFLRAALAKKSRTRTLASAVMRLADELDMDVTAECAETLEDLELIRTLGCDDVQGFLFGRPMEQEDARALAAQSKPVDAKEAARQRPPRHSIIRRGALAAGGVSSPVRLRNVSAGGAMVESDRELEVGEIVELDLGDGLRVPATVRWAHDARLGLQFSDAFDLGNLSRLKREAPEVRMLKPDYLKGVESRTSGLSIRDIRNS